MMVIEARTQMAIEVVQSLEARVKNSAGNAKRILDGTQYYGYPKTAITSDYHSHNDLRGIFGGFLDLFSCRKTATKSSGIPGFIFVTENDHKSSP
jgi:hypothetical protein